MIVKSINPQLDSVFGSFSWSLSERYLLYVAEKKIAKAKSYFSEASSESTEVGCFMFQSNKQWKQ